MTAPFDPDELASAYLDGEVTAEEAARVEADPALQQRVEELRRAANALAGPVPAPPGTPDRLVERAVVVGTAPEPISLADRARTRRWVLTGLSAAAAVGILALTANVLLEEGDPETSQLAGGDSDEAAEDLFEGSGAAPADLGQIDDEGELRAQVQDATGLGGSPAQSFGAEEAPAAEALPGDEAADTAAGGGTESTESGGELLPPAGGPGEPISQECEIELVTREPDIAGQLFQATATYQGDHAIVYVYTRPDDDPIVFVLAREGCGELTSFPLEG